MKRFTLIFPLGFLLVLPAFAHEGHAVHAERALDISLLGFAGLREMFNVHPAFVHFPIALIPSALLLYVFGALWRNRSLYVAARACLYLSLAGGVIAVVTGLTAQESFPHNEAIHHVMQTHKTIGLALAGILVVLTAWSFWQEDGRPKGLWGFLTLLALASCLVLQNADLGSRMVYLQGAAVKPAVSAMANAKDAYDDDDEHRPSH